MKFKTAVFFIVYITHIPLVAGSTTGRLGIVFFTILRNFNFFTDFTHWYAWNDFGLSFDAPCD